ncbi:MAG: hypothetical protein LM582_03945 [Desulfurococcaceae archaeon]|jgi:hypothetical protein|nr:hypothetical protein [Desulfurococcaceae archaeon]
MDTSWRDIVEELFNNIDNILILCPNCTPDDRCISEFSLTSLIDIRILTECCACLLENILESKHNIYRTYRYNEFGESVAIYKLKDVVVEITTSVAMVIPIDKVEEYIEMLRETGVQDIETLKNWLKESK